MSVKKFMVVALLVFGSAAYAENSVDFEQGNLKNRAAKMDSEKAAAIIAENTVKKSAMGTSEKDDSEPVVESNMFAACVPCAFAASLAAYSEEFKKFISDVHAKHPKLTKLAAAAGIIATAAVIYELVIKADDLEEEATV